MEILYIDSKYRVAGTISDFTWGLRETLKSGDTTHVRVEQFKLVNSLWTVEQENRYIYFNLEGKPLEAVPHEWGFFSGTDIASHLTARLGDYGFEIVYCLYLTRLKSQMTKAFTSGLIKNLLLCLQASGYTSLMARARPCQ